MQESFEWVLRVLLSCKTSFHMQCAKTVVELFHSQYGNGPHYDQLIEEMNKKEPMLIDPLPVW